jgi:hypothetical protein
MPGTQTASLVSNSHANFGANCGPLFADFRIRRATRIEVRLSGGACDILMRWLAPRRANREDRVVALQEDRQGLGLRPSRVN